MLVLNRRPGESIVIEPDLRVTVLSVANHKVWIGFDAAGSGHGVNLCASPATSSDARLELAPVRAVEFVGDGVRVSVGEGDHPSVRACSTLAVQRALGQRVEVGDALWVAVGAMSKGNATLRFGGDAVGDELGITLIRPAGSYVRVGVEAPGRRVYRQELWEVVQRGSGTRPAASPAPQEPPRPRHTSHTPDEVHAGAAAVGLLTAPPPPGAAAAWTGPPG